MKGAVGFVVGLIGLCLFGSMPMLMPALTQRNDQTVGILLVLVAVAFVFLNIMIVGFYRMMGHLHETVLYPDDAYAYPQRGRVLFFLGYIGLLVTLVFLALLAFLPEWTGFRIRHREMEMFALIAWFVAWVFFGLLLGGVYLMLSDIYHKAFYRTMVNPPEERATHPADDIDISLGAARRPRRTDGDSPRRWD